jgi:hypothetical protein
LRADRGFPPQGPPDTDTYQFNCTFTAWHPETGGANWSEPERAWARLGENLRRWHESKGWDVPWMARELRKAARDTGDDVAAHHSLVKMIPQ